MERLTAKVNPFFWESKRVFITGHTGFKGSWLSLWLQAMGAQLKGYSIDIPTKPALFEEANVGDYMESIQGDIRQLDMLQAEMKSFNPDILIHMAAQPLVRYSYKDPIGTYTTNVIGTANVLEAAKACGNLKAIISVTTDKCYENKEWHWGYREIDPLGGHDPYSSSKGCAELVTSAYQRSFFYSNDTPAVASARAGNVIGGGDWASDRLIPDILRAFDKEKPVIIRNPKATRPWQHVLEPLSGYLILAEKLYSDGNSFAGAWNFGPLESSVKPVSWILDKMVEEWGSGASWKLDTDANPHEAGLLKLDCSKALSELNWAPKWELDYSLKLIVSWHQNWRNGLSVKEQCLAEIDSYQNSLS